MELTHEVISEFTHAPQQQLSMLSSEQLELVSGAAGMPRAPGDPLSRMVAQTPGFMLGGSTPSYEPIVW